MREACFVSEAQRHAQAAVEDGLRNPALLALAQLGHDGQHPQNVERDFHRAFGHGSACAFEVSPYWVNVPLKKLKGHGHELRAIPVLAPHEVWALLHRVLLVQR